MIKSFKSVLYFIGVLSISMFIDSNVELFMTVDNEIDAGSEITVLINISKGDNRSFARFQQELPNGLTVSPLNLSNGNFIFEDNKLKIIWLKLPEADDFTGLGDFSLTGNTLHKTTFQNTAITFGKPFAKIIFKMPLNQWQGPYESFRGIHYVRVNATHDPELPPFEQMESFLDRKSVV